MNICFSTGSQYINNGSLATKIPSAVIGAGNVGYINLGSAPYPLREDIFYYALDGLSAFYPNPIFMSGFSVPIISTATLSNLKVAINYGGTIATDIGPSVDFVFNLQFVRPDSVYYEPTGLEVTLTVPTSNSRSNYYIQGSSNSTFALPSPNCQLILVFAGNDLEFFGNNYLSVTASVTAN